MELWVPEASGEEEPEGRGHHSDRVSQSLCVDPAGSRVTWRMLAQCAKLGRKDTDCELTLGRRAQSTFGTSSETSRNPPLGAEEHSARVCGV